LPTTKNSNKTIVEFTRMIPGKEYKDITGKLNRMRRRHDFIYDSKNHITSNEANSSIEAA
jgi:cobalamin biosynthesis Co2+ chelatase CbiK